MVGLIKLMFIGLLTSIISTSNHPKCIPLSKQKCIIDLLLLIYILVNTVKILHYYPLEVNLDRCIGSYNTRNDLSNKLCVPNKTKDLNLNLFNMITRINKSKTLTKHI